MTTLPKIEILGEIEKDVFDKMISNLVDSGELRKNGFSVLVFGHGSQTRGLYRELKQDPDVELFWTGWSGPKWLWFLSFIPGQAGLLKIKNLANTKEIYERVGALSFCGLYFIPESKIQALIDLVKKDYWKFSIEDHLYKLFESENEFFLLDTDFDYNGGDRDGEIYYWHLQYGQNISDSMKKVFNIECE